MPEEYSFREVGESCGVCEKAFVETDDMFSALRRDEESYARLDFCVPCWDRNEDDGLLCHWKRKPRLKETQPTVDGVVVFDIFQRLAESNDRHDQNFRYILGLLLMRRKRLRFVDVERTEDGEFLIMDDRLLDGVKYRLLDPGMNEEEMEKAKEEVGKLFSVNVEGEKPDKDTKGSAEDVTAEDVQQAPEESDEAASGVSDGEFESGDENSNDSDEESADASDPEVH